MSNKFITLKVFFIRKIIDIFAMIYFLLIYLLILARAI